MRQIKFRGWSEHYKNFGYSDRDGLAAFFAGVAEAEKVGRKVHLQQFTGLQDKNGKEIYEGDVVEVEDGPNKKKREVVWHKPSASFTLKLGNGSTEYLPNYVKYGQLEIIGNIYENPELLK